MEILRMGAVHLGFGHANFDITMQSKVVCKGKGVNQYLEVV